MITTNPLTGQAGQPQGIGRASTSVDLHRDARRVSESLSILRHGRPNLLIIGSAIQNERALDQVRPMLRAPVVRWSPAERPEIPGIAFRT